MASIMTPTCERSRSIVAAALPCLPRVTTLASLSPHRFARHELRGPAPSRAISLRDRRSVLLTAKIFPRSVVRARLQGGEGDEASPSRGEASGGNPGAGTALGAQALRGKELTAADLDVWKSKPAWCQPWTILLTGTVLISGSWLTFHAEWFTGLVSVGISAWWVTFLVLYPNAYKEYKMSSSSGDEQM